VSQLLRRSRLTGDTLKLLHRWVRFPWQVSRLELTLVRTHPDCSGGVGFLGLVGYAFVPPLLTQAVRMVF
jgi:hypothetical protein